jgi:hypothetical protein
MEECYEITPGESIGPFRLGMTREVTEGLNILPMETGEDGSVAIFRSVGVSVFYDVSGKCEKIEARVWGGFLSPGEHVVKCLLGGRIVNDLSERDACELFKSISPDIKYGYASFELPSVGLGALKWEASDDFLYAIYVVPPGEG